MKRLYLVDAHAFLHRAYHALPPLTNSKGQPVGALFGFARMLLMLMRKEKPDAVAVCFDRAEKTFRHEAHKEYKATRKEIDEDLIWQLGQAGEMAEAMGYRCVDAAGFEADDVMATLASGAKKGGWEAVLVTGDKDALQLVGPGIRVLNVAKDNTWMDAPQVEAKLGVRPDQVVDYLSLIGDSSDNVPGVKGIGPVGAVKLLKQFGTLEKILAAAKAGDPAITPKTAKVLVEGEKDALSSKSLITLVTDAPIGCEAESVGLPKIDEAKLKDVFGKLEFGKLLTEMLGAGAVVEEAAGPSGVSSRVEPAGAPATAGLAAIAVLEPLVKVEIKETGLEAILAGIKKSGAATVTAIPDPGDELLDRSAAHVALGLEDGRVALFGENELQEHRKAVAEVLKGKALKVGYHLKETRRALAALKLEISGPVFDTMLAAWCVDPTDSVSALAGDSWRERLLGRAARAGGREDLERRLKDTGTLKLFAEVEAPLSEILRRMEDEGVALDAPYLRLLSGEFEKDINARKLELDGLAGFPINVNSPKQLGDLLFDKLGLPVIHKTAKGGRSTDEEALTQLAALNPIPAKVLEYRELTKLKSTYIDGLLGCVDEGGRVHTRFDQTGTTTGRLSSTDPNLQNIPIRSAAGQRIRKAFIARPGWILVSADYSQIDLRVLAHESGDPALCEAFAHGGDIHTRTAAEMFKVPPEQVDKELRRRAKAINFGIVYGQSAFGLANLLGIPQREAADYIKAYFARYQGVQAWIEKNLAEARAKGAVRTLLGRVRHLPELAAKNTQVRQFAERAARNTPIQGGSADIIKLAMLKVHEGLSSGKRGQAKMLLQIHDELLFEAPLKEARALSAWVKAEMESAIALKVPLVVDVKLGENWQDMRPEAG